MDTAAFYDVIDALVAAMPTALPGVLVLDGYGSTDDQRDRLLIGVDDPGNLDEARSASSRKQFGVTGYHAVLDEGEVTCVAVASNGNGDQRAARDAARAIVTATAAVVTADRTLGLPRVLWTRLADEELRQDQTDAGAEARVVFTIQYNARLGAYL